MSITGIVAAPALAGNRVGTDRAAANYDRQIRGAPDGRREGRREHAGEMTTGADQLTTLLDRQGIAYDVLRHRHTDSAREEAEALALDPHDVAKTVVVTTSRGYIRAVIPACERLDVRKLRELLLLREQPHLAGETDLAAAYPSFELGAVPPVGGPGGDRVAVDRRLADRDTLVIEAGSHDESLRLATTDLLVLAHAAIGDLCLAS
jgi:Ala-tRNA(Pro) deacylase